MNINLPRDLPYLLQLTPQEKTDLFIWYLILMVLVIFSILVVIILKHLLKRRKPSRTTQLALDLEVLERMRRTGLLYPEEEERARAAIKKYLAQQLEQSLAGTPQEKSPLSPQQPAVETSQHLVGLMPEKATSSPQAACPSAPSKPSAENKAIDVEELHRRGIITDEEYQQLRAFFEQKH